MELRLGYQDGLWSLVRRAARNDRGDLDNDDGRARVIENLDVQAAPCPGRLRTVTQQFGGVDDCVKPCVFDIPQFTVFRSEREASAGTLKLVARHLIRRL